MGEGRYNNRTAAQRGMGHRLRTYPLLPEMPKPAEVSGRSRGYSASRENREGFPAVGLIASLVERDRLLNQLAFVRSMR